jgi:DHA2 family multidrug resistance protein
MAQAIYGLGVIVGPTLGPPLGGFIVDSSSWPYIFYINIPLGIIATLLTLQFVKSPRYTAKSTMKDIDWGGIALLAIFVGSLQYILEKGQDDDWFNDSTITILAVTALLGFFLFLWRELTFRNPVVNLRVLKNTNLRVGTILSFILGFGLYGSTFIIPLYTQASLGWTATQSGLLLVPAALTTAFMMPIIGRLLQKGVPQQYLVAAGMLLFAGFCFYGYKILTPDTSSDSFFWMLIVRGVGMGMLFIPITTLALSRLKGREIGEGAAFTGMMRQLGGSFGVALITTFMARQIMVHRNNLVGHLNINDPEVQNRLAGLKASFMAKGHAANIAQQEAYKILDGSVMRQAAVLSYMDVFYWIGIMFLICIPFVLMVKGNRGQKLDMSAAH